MGGNGVFDRSRDGGERSLVKDEVYVLAGGLHGGKIAEVCLLKCDLVADTGEVFEIAGRKIINSADLMTLLYESVG